MGRSDGNRVYGGYGLRWRPGASGEVGPCLEAQPLGQRGLSLADGSLFVSPALEVLLDWNDEPRLTEVLILEGSPLLGVVLMEGLHLNVAMESGGKVSLEPL